MLATLYSQRVESSRQFIYPHRGQKQSRFYWKTVVLVTLNPFGENPLGMCHTKMACRPSIIPTQTISPLILFLLMSNRWGSWLVLGLLCHRCTLCFHINQPRDHTTAVVSRVLASLWTPRLMGGGGQWRPSWDDSHRLNLCKIWAWAHTYNASTWGTEKSRT